MNVVASAVAAFVIMAALWQGFDARITVIFVICLALSEVFIRLRWRLSVLCSSCGFDPVLYLKQPAQAAEKVKAHLERRKEDPKYLLSRPLNLPTITPDQAKLSLAKEKRGTLVSRQI